MNRLALALAITALSTVAVAQPAPNAEAEGRAHFERGVSLFTDNDYAAALVEFQRAMELLRRPSLLYNIAVTHESLGHYVEALDALRVFQMQAPPEAVARHRAEVDAALQRLPSRIGTLRVLTDVPGLTVRVDGVERPVERLRDGLAVSAGTRRVTLRAPGFEPLEREVPVVGGATVEVRDALEPVRSSLRVECAVPGARVLIDGRALAITPLREALRVPEGRHRVRVEREGYVPYETEVEVHGQGASVEAGLAWRDPLPDAQAARLRVNASRPGAVAFIDGRRVSVDGRDAIPPGPHRLRVEVDRYLPHERDVTLVAGATTPVSVWMDPSPAYREEALSQIRARRRVAFVVGGVGLGLLVAGGVGLAVFAPRYASDLDALDAADARVRSCELSSTCDNRAELATRNAAENAAYDSQNATIVSGVVAGAGLVTTVVGAVLLGNAGSLDRFERPPSWSVSLSPRGAGLSLSF